MKTKSLTLIISLAILLCIGIVFFAGVTNTKQPVSSGPIENIDASTTTLSVQPGEIDVASSSLQSPMEMYQKLGEADMVGKVLGSKSLYQGKTFGFFCLTPELAGGDSDRCTLVAKNSLGELFRIGYAQSIKYQIQFSPDKQHLLFTEEDFVKIINTESLEEIKKQQFPKGFEYGYYTELPAFVPTVSWKNNSTIEVGVYPESTWVERFENPTTGYYEVKIPTPIRTEEITI